MHESLYMPHRINELVFYSVVTKDLLCQSFLVLQEPSFLHFYNTQKTLDQGCDHGSAMYM